MRLLSALLILLGGFAGTHAALAQTGTVAGRVTDAAGEALPGVNVVLAGTRLGAATDAGGRYSIAAVPPGTYTAIASAVGFRREAQAVVVRAGQTASADFVLAEALLEGDEVVVTATRSAQAARDVAASVSVVGARELEARNVRAIDEALRYVPGVQVKGNQIDVRGSSGFSYNVGSRVLLLVDGAPLLGPESGSLPYDALPLTQIARIEVLKGPGSALYGGGALGGVVNVLTKPFPERPETEVRLYAGAHEPTRYAIWRARWDEADTFRPLGGVTLTHARRLGERAGAWATVTARSDREHLNVRRSDYVQGALKLEGSIRPSLRAEVLGSYLWRQRDNFLYWNGARDALNPGSLALTGSDTTGANDQQSTQAALLPTLTYLPGANVALHLRGRFFRAAYQPLDEDGRPRGLDAGTVGYRYGAEVQTDAQLRPGRLLTLGASADGNAATSSFFGDDGLVFGQPEAAAFAQWQERLGTRVHVTAGLRFDAYWLDTDETVTKLSPKLSATFTPAEPVVVRAAFGQGFRVPSLAERFTSNRDFLPILPNLRLRPEESTGYEVGMKAALPTGPLTTGLDVALFWTNYDGLVEPVFVTAPEAGFQFVNLTQARVRGAEATLDAALPAERAVVRLGYTFLDTRDLTADAPLVFRSRHLLIGSLTARLAGPLEGGLDVRLASAPERVDTDFARFVPDADLLVPVKVVDLRLGVRRARWDVALLAKNALDYYYLDRPALLAPSRHFVMQMAIRF